jgi:hypothetical protein
MSCSRAAWPSATWGEPTCCDSPLNIHLAESLALSMPRAVCRTAECDAINSSLSEELTRGRAPPRLCWCKRLSQFDYE